MKQQKEKSKLKVKNDFQIAYAKICLNNLIHTKNQNAISSWFFSFLKKT